MGAIDTRGKKDDVCGAENVEILHATNEEFLIGKRATYA